MLAAVLTPSGRGALAVLHVCGEGSRELVRGLFRRDFDERPRYGTLFDGEQAVDEVMVRTAEGFTGEETVEITCHGGAAAIERVLDALASRGARRVNAAGLLERAVATGHLDRVQSEAYGVLPTAGTELAAQVFQDQARGALSRAVESMGEVRDAERLLRSAELGLALSEPRRVVLAGSPNVGKSTLFNALVEADRALVSPLAGTTRDPVRERIAVEGVPFELVDTAGVEATSDPLTRSSIERTHRRVEEADVILFVFDGASGASDEELRWLDRLRSKRVIPVANKVDLGGREPSFAHPVSARTGEGLEGLRRRILSVMGLVPRFEEGQAVVFTRRQQGLLLDAAGGKVSMESIRGKLLRGPA